MAGRRVALLAAYLILILAFAMNVFAVSPVIASSRIAMSLYNDSLQAWCNATDADSEVFYDALMYKEGVLTEAYYGVSPLGDASGNRYNLSNVGAVWNTTNGYYDGGMVFNNSVALYSSKSFANDLNITTQLTLMAWASVLGEDGGYIAGELRGTAHPTDKYGLYISSSGYLRWRLDTTSAQLDYINSVDRRNTGWFHATGTYNGSSACLYFNSSLIACSNLNGSIINNVSGNFAIGNRVDSLSRLTSTSFNGSIDEVRLFNCVLTAAEIAAEMNSRYALKKECLLGSWSFRNDSTVAGVERNVFNTTSTIAGGQNWTLSCQATDGAGSSAALNSSVFNVVNVLPIITSARVNMTQYYDKVGVWCTASEGDGQAVTYAVDIYSSGVLNESFTMGSSVAPGVETNVVNVSAAAFTGQNWTATCRASDGSGYGMPVNSSSFIVPNVAPVMSQSFFNYSEDNVTLQAWCSGVDVDNDGIMYTALAYKDGVLNETYYGVDPLGDASGNGYDLLKTGTLNYNSATESFEFPNPPAGKLNSTLNTSLVRAFSVWVNNVNNTPSNKVWVSTTNIIGWFKQSTNDWQVYMWNGTDRVRWRYVQPKNNSEEWTHYAMFISPYDDKVLYVYENGVLKYTSISDGSGVGMPYGLGMGNVSGTFPSGGMNVSKLALYSDHLTVADVALLYRNRTVTHDLLAYYPFRNDTVPSGTLQNRMNITSTLVSGQEWTLSCYGDDNKNRGPALNSSTLLVTNVAPVMVGSFFTPAVAQYNETVYAWCNASDSDNDLLYYDAELYKDGLLNATYVGVVPVLQGTPDNVFTITGHDTGQNWTLTCRASDTMSRSYDLSSTGYVIRSATPVMVSAGFVPSTAHFNTVVDVRCNATDYEGDMLTYDVDLYRNWALNRSYYSTRPYEDATGNDFNLVEYDSPVYDAAGERYFFDGVDGYLYGTFDGSTTATTISAYVCRDGNNSDAYQTIFDTVISAPPVSPFTYRKFEMYWRPTGEIIWRVVNSTAAQLEINADVDKYIVTGCANIVGIYDGYNAWMYINGVLQNETGSIASVRTDPVMPMSVGRLGYQVGNWYMLNGSIADLRVFGRVLSEAEIAALNNNVSVESGLVSWWPFRDDRSPSGVMKTVLNMTDTLVVDDIWTLSCRANDGVTSSAALNESVMVVVACVPNWTCGGFNDLMCATGTTMPCYVANDTENCEVPYGGLLSDLGSMPCPINSSVVFDGATTDFTGSNTTLFSQPVIEVVGVGRIGWTGSNLNFSGANFGLHVHIGDGYIAVDSQYLPADVNTRAQLTIVKPGLNTAQVFRDGEPCRTCSDFTYTGGVATFTVSGFSNYSVGEKFSYYEQDLKLIVVDGLGVTGAELVSWIDLVVLAMVLAGIAGIALKFSKRR